MNAETDSWLHSCAGFSAGSSVGNIVGPQMIVGDWLGSFPYRFPSATMTDSNSRVCDMSHT
jgi:hypothetical protein